MRVGIDGSCWANRRGFGRFTRCLVETMVRRTSGVDHVLLLDQASADDPSLPPLPADLDVAAVDVGAPPAQAAGAASSRTLRDIAKMTRAARRLGCDVFFFPATYSYFPVPGTPVVVTIHDAIAERLPELTLRSRGNRLRWWLKQHAAVREAKSIITVSEASRAAIIDHLGVRPERLHVIREAPEPSFRPLSAGERDPHLARWGLAACPYLLYVGGISPHKNIGTLVEAFAPVAADRQDVRLVLVGDLEDDPFLSAVDSVRDAIERSPAHDRILLTGYVSDAELVALYAGAAASVLPSLGEGFGLTAAESAACGTPVVTSRDPALVELLGDDGIYADARSARAFEVAFRRLLSDPRYRAERSGAVAARAATWSWDAAAERAGAILEAAAYGGGDT